MDKIFQKYFQGVRDHNFNQVKEIIQALSKDKLDTGPDLLEKYKFENITLESDQEKFEKEIVIIKLDSSHVYGSNSSGRDQFAAVTYKIPIVDGNPATLKFKPKHFSPDHSITEEIIYGEKNISFAIGTMNVNELLSKYEIEDIKKSKARILTFLDKNISFLNQDIDTYNADLGNLINVAIEKRKAYLEKEDEVLIEL